jgi:beta-glucanase (GH16 family)
MRLVPPFLAALLAAAPLAAQESGQRLVWSDEFNQPLGSSPDAAKWVFALGHGGDGWGNHELEEYTASPANCSVVADPAAEDGHALAIRAIHSSAGYTSARMHTQGKFAAEYGFIAARMRLPKGRGIWPAFWMLGSSFPKVEWPACGEIDVMENLGHLTHRVYGTVHGPGYSGGKGIQGVYDLPGAAGLDEAYHVYAVLWRPGRIEWSLDGHVYSTVTPARLPAGTRWVFDQPFFLLLNLAVGGDWPKGPDATTAFPQTLYVDYVRVYSRAP